MTSLYVMAALAHIWVFQAIWLTLDFLVWPLDWEGCALNTDVFSMERNALAWGSRFLCWKLVRGLLLFCCQASSSHLSAWFLFFQQQRCGLRGPTSCRQALWGFSPASQLVGVGVQLLLLLVLATPRPFAWSVGLSFPCVEFLLWIMGRALCYHSWTINRVPRDSYPLGCLVKTQIGPNSLTKKGNRRKRWRDR